MSSTPQTDFDPSGFDPLLEGVEWLDGDGRTLYRNPAARALGEPASSYPEARAAVASVAAGGPEVRLEVRVGPEGGATPWRELSIRPWKAGVLVLSSDTSARHELAAQTLTLKTQLAASLRAAPIPMSLTDAETEAWIEVNDAFCRLVEYPREALVGRSFRDLGLWARPDQRRLLLDGLAAEGRVAGLEVDLVARTGGLKTVQLFAEVLDLEGRDALLIQGLDVTGARADRERLRASEENYRLLAENISDVVWILDLESGRYRYVSPSVERLRGFTVEEVLGQTMAESITAESAAHLAAVLPARLAEWQAGGRHSYSDEIVQPHRDGHLVVTETSTQFVVSAATGRLEVFGSSRDIGARKAAERDQAVSEARYRSLFDTSYLGIAVWDADGRLVLGNLRFREECRHPDPVGRRIDELFALRADEVLDRVEAIRSSRQVKTFTTKMPGVGGPRWFRISYQPLFDADGEFTGFQTLGQDVTESYQLNEQVFDIERKEMIAVLAGGLAHDLNNLLAGLQGHMDLAILNLGQGEVGKSADHLEKAREVFRRTRNLTRQLLSFSRERTVRKEITLLGPRFREWAEFSLAGADQELHLDVPTDLWACECDQEQVGQVVDNLLINARQASPAGGRIWLTARNLAGPVAQIEVTVDDEGPGIPEALAARIFDPFFTTKAQGSGLGLASSKTAVEDHGGTITAGASPRGGARFTVRLPASVSARSALRHEEKKEFRDSGTALVMDDDPFVRETVVESLESFGYRVIAARNGQDALAFWRAERDQGRPVKLAVLDLTVPGGLGGRETAQRLAAEAGAPVLVGMTGYAATASRGDGPGPFAVILAKPFSLGQLARALASVVGPGIP